MASQSDVGYQDAFDGAAVEAVKEPRGKSELPQPVKIIVNI